MNAQTPQPIRILAHAAIITIVGTAIGVVDAQLRPVKLGREVAEFDLGSPPAPAGDADVSGSDGSLPPEPSVQASPPGEQPPVPPTATPTATPAAEGGSGGFKFTPKSAMKAGHITIDEAKQAFDLQRASFVDARTKAKFEEGHIPGAIRLELADFIAGQPAKLGLLPRELMVIVYCGGGDCDESERVAERLEGFGYRPIFIIHDGFPGWQAAGHDVETGPEEFE